MLLMLIARDRSKPAARAIAYHRRMRAILLGALLVAACSSRSGPIKLIEGYCAANEADRCYYDHQPMDGF